MSLDALRQEQEELRRDLNSLHPHQADKRRTLELQLYAVDKRIADREYDEARIQAREPTEAIPHRNVMTLEDQRLWLEELKKLYGDRHTMVRSLETGHEAWAKSQRMFTLEDHHEFIESLLRRYGDAKNMIAVLEHPIAERSQEEEPIDFMMANPHLSFAAANAIKHIHRHTFKNGAEDLVKALDYIRIELENSYGLIVKASVSTTEYAEICIRGIEATYLEEPGCVTEDSCEAELHTREIEATLRKGITNPGASKNRSAESKKSKQYPSGDIRSTLDKALRKPKV